MTLRAHLKRWEALLLGVLGEFTGDFMLGLAVGVTVICLVLYRFRGISYAMSPYGQFHLLSVNLFFLLIPLAYYLLRGEPNNGKRVLGSLFFPLIVFSLHDIAWLIETHFVPQVYLNGLILRGATLEEYSYHYSKNLINLIPSCAVFYVYKFFKFDRKCLVSFIGMGAFHLFNILFQVNLYVLNGYALLGMELIDSIPYLLLIRKE